MFTCSLARAVHLEPLPDKTTKEFIKALKRVTARRGTPDKDKPFIAASKWIKSIEEELNDFLNKKSGRWRFILSCVSW